MLKNHSTNTFHPLLLLENPLPGNPSNLIRLKSKGHHTTGFIDRDEAVKHIYEMQKDVLNIYDTMPKLDIEKDLDWDGLDIPAMVEILSLKDFE